MRKGPIFTQVLHGWHRANRCTRFWGFLWEPSHDIKSAYRRLARTCHPDVALDRKDTSADEFMKIHAAYSTLSDPEKRAVYDRKFFRRNGPLTSSFPRYRGRNWETDQCCKKNCQLID
ncbi:hypothetical protein GH714_015957 [Hevea brasiliensis]|uniref:J domain-containing protein n=1 Tax=Hevea brasiliensis TaxID=3981 RepID=A0A6A6M0D9_HEVBR|nr:hypothetical protein GH714_015957 [Hevea brasiliensis]